MYAHSERFGGILASLSTRATTRPFSVHISIAKTLSFDHPTVHTSVNNLKQFKHRPRPPELSAGSDTLARIHLEGSSYSPTVNCPQAQVTFVSSMHETLLRTAAQTSDSRRLPHLAREVLPSTVLNARSLKRAYPLNPPYAPRPWHLDHLHYLHHAVFRRACDEACVPGSHVNMGIIRPPTTNPSSAMVLLNPFQFRHRRISGWCTRWIVEVYNAARGELKNLDPHYCRQ